MSVFVIVAYSGGLACLALALVVAFRRPRDLSQAAFTIGMLLLAFEDIATGLSLRADSIEAIGRWQNLRLWATSISVPVWLLFSLVYARGNYRNFLAKWWPGPVAIFLFSVCIIVIFRERLILLQEQILPPFGWYLRLSRPACILSVVLLVGIILTLMHLERTLRTSIGTMRWRIKFVIMGLVVLLTTRIYTTSQVLLYSRIDLTLQNVDAIALLLTCVLLGLSFYRAGLWKVDVYPSPRILQSSITVLLAGLYLVAVGLVAQLITAFGGNAGFTLKVLFVLISLIVLGALLLSERARQHLRLFLTRHLQRPWYDYRSVWTTFTSRTSFIMDKTQLSEAVVKWVSDTFNALSVTIWLVDDVTQKIILGASTSVSKAQGSSTLELDGEASPLLEHLRHVRSPIDLETTTEPWITALNVATTSFFPNGGKRFCMPLLGKGEVIGILTLGDRVNGVPFTFEDFELLKCISEQAANNLVNIQLSQKLLQVKQMEAFQTMAAFFVHDLKNMGSTLSLMLQNLAVHFDKPEFREDALRSLSRSVGHLNDLISRLTMLRQQVEIQRVPKDLNEVVTRALQQAPANSLINVAQKLSPLPKIAMDSDQLQKVITNLLLNAFEAVGERGEVRVETRQRHKWACLSIQDNGAGMSSEFMARSLFRPFQTTKKKGIGIGVFLSKMIVEAHEGKIEVESQPGKGTTFRILLPTLAE